MNRVVLPCKCRPCCWFSSSCRRPEKRVWAPEATRVVAGDVAATEVETRLRVCQVHIALAHVAWNAHLESWKDLADVVRCLEPLIEDPA